jgi:chorismate mutase-like protein
MTLPSFAVVARRFSARPPSKYGFPSSRRQGIAAMTACALISIALPMSTQAATDNASQAEGVLLNIVSLASARLATATPIAQWKWQNKQAVVDPQQDKADAGVMRDLVKEATHFGLTADYATSFFNDQTIANNQLQSALFDQWHHDGPPPPPDETALQDARGNVYQISEAMLAALAQAQTISQQAECPIWLSKAQTRWVTQMTTLSPTQQAALKTALRNVCRGGIGGTA